MKLYLIPKTGPRRKMKLRADGAVGILDGPCPVCGALPCKIVGQDRRIAKDDRAYESTAYCTECVGAGSIGTIRAEMDTLFGVAEDERVLGSGVKIY